MDQLTCLEKSSAFCEFLKLAQHIYIYAACAQAGGIASDGRYEETFSHSTSNSNGDVVRKEREKTGITLSG